MARKLSETADEWLPFQGCTCQQCILRVAEMVLRLGPPVPVSGWRVVSPVGVLRAETITEEEARALARPVDIVQFRVADVWRTVLH